MTCKKNKKPHRHDWKETGRHVEQAERGPIAGWEVVSSSCKCGQTKEERNSVD